MIQINLLVITVLSVIMIAAAILAVVARKNHTAILASGIISLFASIVFIILASPDVAMTEAAIGAGLTTFIFFIVLRKIERQNGEK